MKKILSLSAVLLFSLFFLSTSAFALLTLGSQITIYDQKSDGNTYHGVAEDEEVEPGMAHGQKWDLEGFFLNGNTLSMVGGFDFKDGGSSNNSPTGYWKSGDIFFDVDGTPQFGTDIANGSSHGNKSIESTYGYDFAIKLDFDDNTFDLYQATSEAKTISSFFKQNYSSNPYQIGDGWNKITGGIEFGFAESIADNDSLLNGIFDGGSHYIIQLLLPSEVQGFNYVHFTEQCGNDNLMGANPVPEPATMLLLGVGLIGLAGLGRKKFKK